MSRSAPAYVRNAWYVAGWSRDLMPEKPQAITILGEPIVFWRDGEGKVSALEDRCVHRLAPLSRGRCEGGNLRCMYHGLLYATDGRVLEIPGQDIIPPRAKVRSYPAIDRHDWIWIWMGEADKVDLDLIPPAVGEGCGFLLGRGELDYAAEARLINDNLLDFSHLSYVHANSFNAGPEFAANPPKVTPLDRGVRVERWIAGTFGSAARRSDTPVDSWQSYDFLVPGVLLMWSANYAPGTAEALNFTSPDPEAAIAGLNFTSQAVTPLTDKTSRYFFSWGPHERQGDAAMRETMMAMAETAFAEDKVIIEAQQKVIDRTEVPQIMPTKHDYGITLFNRLINRLA